MDFSTVAACLSSLETIVNVSIHIIFTHSLLYTIIVLHYQHVWMAGLDKTVT